MAFLLLVDAPAAPGRRRQVLSRSSLPPKRNTRARVRRRPPPCRPAFRGGERVDAAEATQARDQLGVRAVGNQLGDRAIKRRATLAESLDRAQVVGEGRPRGGVVERETAEPLAVVLGPVVARSRVAQ